MTQQQNSPNNEIPKYIRHRWQFLYNSAIEQEAIASKYFTALNAGGAVAVLAYLGSIDKILVEDFKQLYWAVAAFSLGLLVMASYQWCSKKRYDTIASKFMENTRRFNRGEISFEELLDKDNQESRPAYYLDHHLKIALACFTVGGAIAGYFFIIP